MMVECLRCKAKHDLNEAAMQEDLYCASCFAPLTRDQAVLTETVEHNNREIDKLKGAKVSYGGSNHRTD